MASIINYIWQSTFCLAFFYGLYWVFLKNEKTFLVNRVYLLLAPVLALIFPLVEIPVAFNKPSISLENTAFLRAFDGTDTEEIAGAFGLPEVTVTGSKLPVPWEVTDYLLLVYLLVVALLSIHVLWQYFQLRQLLEKGWYQTVYVLKGNYFKVPTYGLAPVFSFFDKVFWEEHPHLQAGEKAQILEHELEHVRQRHSYDVLYYQVLSILFWFNPMVHLMRMALVDLHEYQADAQVLKRIANKLSYTQLIAKMAFKGLDLPLGSYFVRSTTLNRILMIKRPQKTNWFKLLMLVPLMLMLFGLVSMKTKEGITLFNQISTRPVHLLKNQILAAQDSLQVGIKIKNMKNPVHYERIGALENQQLVAQLGELSYEFSGIHSESEYLQVLQLIESLRSNSTMVKRYENALDFESVDQQPLPAAGWASWYDYLQQNLQASRKGLRPVSGSVALEFIVDQEGRIRHPVIKKSFGGTVDQQLLDAVSHPDGPRWIPGAHAGSRVPVVVQASLFLTDYPRDLEMSQRINSQPQLPAGNSPNTGKTQTKASSEGKFTPEETVNDLKSGTIRLGDAAKRHFLKKLKYPTTDREEGIVGTALLKIRTDGEGKVLSYEIVEPLSLEIKEMLLSVLNDLPPLEPVHPKDTYLVLLPVTFQLRDRDIPLPPSQKEMYGEEITVNGYGKSNAGKERKPALPALHKKVPLQILNRDYLIIDGFTLPMSADLSKSIGSIVRLQEWNPETTEVVFYAAEGVKMETIQRVQEALRSNGLRKIDYADQFQSEPFDSTQDPLYIIDGVIQQDKRILTKMNSQRIESIQVMKGDQTGLFGSKAKHGAILIITKK